MTNSTLNSLARASYTTPAASSAGAAPVAPASTAGLPPSPADAANSQSPSAGGFRVGEASDILPDAARQKFLALRDEASELHELLRISMDAKIEAGNAVFAAEAELKRVRIGYATNAAAIERAEARVAKAREDRDRATAREAARSAVWKAKIGVVRNLETYLAQGIGHVEPAPAVALPANKTNKPWAVVLEDHRQRNAAMKADRQDVIDAPRPSSDAKRKVAAFIEGLAAQGEPEVEVVLETDRPFHFRGGYGDSNQTRLLPLIVWACKDEIVSKLDKLIDAASDDEHALDADERQKLLDVIDAKLLEHDRIEEEIVMRALAAGENVERRADVDPRAVLQIVGPKPKGVM